jgi:hypothetical protein
MIERPPNGGQIYTCPMHKGIRRNGPGPCPSCGMALLPEGTRFAMVRHMLSSPMHMVVLGAVMVALMAAV